MRTLKTSWKHMRRSPYQTIAAILTMFITLLIAGMFSLTSFASFEMLRYFESKPQLTVFFLDQASQDEIDTLITTLKQSGKVTNTQYVSKEEALKFYQEKNQNDPLLLEMVTADILPASLEIMPKAPEYLGDIESLMKDSPAIEEIVYQKEVVDSLLQWTRGIRMFMGILVVLLAINAVLIILTVTTMKIALRKEEIDILRLVGASRWYIRSPFILGGGLYGAIGGFLAFIVIACMILYTRTMLVSFLGVVPSLNIMLSNPMDPSFLFSMGGFLCGLITFGFLLGCVGSYSAVNRFLRM